MLTKEVRRSPIDVGVIGIGENSHIAFNDPPADFVTKKLLKLLIWMINARANRLEVGLKRTMMCLRMQLP